LPGCLTQADDFTELGEMIEDAMRVWIESAIEDDVTVPAPKLQEE
jgi:predicted RNase H-like HicB family nuclease